MFKKVHARISNDTLFNPMCTSLKAKGIDPQYWNDNLDEGVKQA